MKKYIKCKLKGSFIKPCKRFNEILNSQNARTGLVFEEIVSIKTGKRTRDWVIAKSGKHKKQGIIINFCPICGVNISNHLFKKTDTQEDK